MTETSISQPMLNKKMSLETGNNKSVPKFGIRHVQVILLLFLAAIGIGMRVQLAVAVVAMTDSTASSNPDVPTYNWKNKSVILSSFYWSYSLLQVIAGVTGKTFGTKKLLIGAMSINSIACLLVPFFAQTFGSYGVMACRILQGLSQSFFYPSIYNLLGQWAPITERSTLGSIIACGSSLGVITANPLVGFMASSWIGWPSTFYLYGSSGLLWVVMWTIFGSNSPGEHKSISVEEKNYIGANQDSVEQIAFKNIPWKAMMCSMPLWAITVSFIGQVWISVTLITELPTYINKVLKFDVQSDGIMSSLPDMAAFCLMFFVALFADYLIKNKYLSIGSTRKVFTVAAMVPYCLSALLLLYIPNDSTWMAVFVLILNGALSSLAASGCGINHIDLSPKYSGIIMSISNSISMLFAILAPLMVQALVTDETDKSQWKIVFFIAIGMCLTCTSFYAFFASGEVQWWNSSEADKSKDPETTLMKIRRASIVSLTRAI